MKRSLQHALLLTFSVALASSSAWAQSKAAFATVNGKPIPQGHADVMFAEPVALGQPVTPEFRQAVKEELVRREVVAQEAIKKGFDKKADIKAKMELARQSVLINAYLNDYVPSQVNDATLKKMYEALKEQEGDKEYKVRHILVETEAEAKTVIENLKKGEKFDDLAKQSKDPGSKDRGGDLGWARRTGYVKPFSDAMVQLEKGKMTETPIKTDFGWHVIQLDDLREVKAPSFEELKPQLAQTLQQQIVVQHIQQLVSKAKVN